MVVGYHFSLNRSYLTLELLIYTSCHPSVSMPAVAIGNKNKNAYHRAGVFTENRSHSLP